MASRSTPRDELSYYTLIAQRADDRDRAYERFIAAWRRMEETDFPTRLRRCIGALPTEEPEPLVAEVAEADEPVSEQAAG
jgi:hypothetical protein